jgi:hypothetical protein
MPYIVTTVHDPRALAATCRRLHLPVPVEGRIEYDDQEAFGWIVRLPGVRYPIVCNTLTGLIAYHRRDNAFERFAPIMSFIYRYFAVQFEMKRAANGTSSRPIKRKSHMSCPVAQAS